MKFAVKKKGGLFFFFAKQVIKVKIKGIIEDLIFLIKKKRKKE